MNKFKKYCPNVWVAECEQEYKKGDIIQVETQHGKKIECEVFNHVGYTGTKEDFKNCYSIIKIEEISYAERKAELYKNSTAKHISNSQDKFSQAQEGKEFLALGEPIKVGHHSERKHRALIDRNDNRMRKGFKLQELAEKSQARAEYWESKATEITLAMPESIEHFKYKLEKAIEYHKGLKNGSIPREHSYSLSYATKDVKELTKKVDFAVKLWEC